MHLDRSSSDIVEAWHRAEPLLEQWRDPEEGGSISHEYLEDNLGRIVDETFAKKLYRLQAQPLDLRTRRAQTLALEVWKRYVALILRAELVANRLCARGLPSGIPPTSTTGPPRALSPVPKCK